MERWEFEALTCQNESKLKKSDAVELTRLPPMFYTACYRSCFIFVFRYPFVSGLVRWFGSSLMFFDWLSVWKQQMCYQKRWRYYLTIK